MPFADVSDRLTKKGNRIADNLRIIENEGARLTRMVNDFLDLSKIESGRLDWHDRLVDPGEVVRMAVDAVSGEYEQSERLMLVVDVSATLPRLWVDPDRIMQVLVNCSPTRPATPAKARWSWPCGLLAANVWNSGSPTPDRVSPRLNGNVSSINSIRSAVAIPPAPKSRARAWAWPSANKSWSVTGAPSGPSPGNRVARLLWWNCPCRILRALRSQGRKAPASRPKPVFPEPGLLQQPRMRTRSRSTGRCQA